MSDQTTGHDPGAEPAPGSSRSSGHASSPGPGSGAGHDEGHGAGHGSASDVRRLAGVIVGTTVALLLMLAAFGLPAVHSGPHDLRIGVAGPSKAVAPISAALDTVQPGGFDVRSYPDEASLRRAITDRDVYGGFVPAAGGLKVLVASAAGAPIAQLITAAGDGIAGVTGAKATLGDVVPYPEDDPRGAGLVAAALPMIIGGILPAVGMIRLFPRRPALRIVGASCFSLLAGFAMAAVLQFWLGTVGGGYLAVSLGLALGMAALSLLFLGLESAFGVAGLGAGVIAMMFIGNPLSGLLAGPDWLPAGWGALGQLLPPGASGALLRATGYFDGAGALAPSLVLCCWAAAGLGLSLLGLRARRRTRDAQGAQGASATAA